MPLLRHAELSFVMQSCHNSSKRQQYVPWQPTTNNIKILLCLAA